MNSNIRFFKKLLAFIAIFLFIQAPSVALASSYKMNGILTAVNLPDKVVVIKFNRNYDLFTVAGPLADNAKLIKSHQPARLEDFKTGKSIDVEWHSTAKGHVIDRLIQY